MTARLQKRGITDKGVWTSHYKRGFDYIDGAIVDEGWDNDIVRAKTKQIFDMMDKDLVFALDTFHPELKLLYAKIEGLDETPPTLTLKQARFYLRETKFFLKQRGLKNSSQLVLREVKRVFRSLSQSA